MLPDLCGSRLLLALPDDILSVITSSLSPGDVCSLGLSCPGLNALLSSDKVWLGLCDKLGLLPLSTIIEWRKGVFSYKALCRFLVNINPLTGIWVHQNPELGNVVYVMPGFLSVVGCRIIPQRIGPLALEFGPILWTPVFEILCKYDGSTAFILHGREQGADYVYPGFIKSVDRDCNVLLLEVQHRNQRDGGKLTQNNEVSKLSRGVSKLQRNFGHKGFEISFSRLGFDERVRKGLSMLLDVVTRQVRTIVPESANVLFFPLFRNDEVDCQQDFTVLHERRLLLLQMYKHGSGNGEESPLIATELLSSEVKKSLDRTISEDHGSQAGTKTLSGFLKNGLKPILRKLSSRNGDQENQSTILDEFLRSGDSVGLSLRAETTKLRYYKSWPYMHGNVPALYKLPIRPHNASDEYAGLWGATFGWPPGQPSSEDKCGKALFLILISYEEKCEGKKHMIGTKILEGKSIARFPNGSRMFTVNVSQPSTSIFPWDVDEESNPLNVEQSFSGEGISDGHGFRYRDSKPGSLFVLENGLLVFVWEESRKVLTLRRLELEELLRKGERVPCLSPVHNFAYLKRKYTNVYSRTSCLDNS